MNNYIPLSMHTHYSLLRGLSQPEQISKYLANNNIGSCSITDYSSVSGAVQFTEKMKKEKLKPILGIKLRVMVGKKETYTTLLAKNLDGWKSLLKLASIQATPDDIKSHAENLIMINGAHRSLLGNAISAADELTIEWKKEGERAIREFKDVFGDDLYIQIQKAHPNDAHLMDPLRDLAKTTKTRVVATPDCHYLTKADFDDHRILLCNDFNSSISNLHDKADDFANRLASSNEYYLPSYEEMVTRGHTEAELAATNEIDSKIADFSILGRSIIPPFPCPKGYNADEYLRQLCREGWNLRIKPKIKPEEVQTYVDRVKYELETLQGAGLSSYFLIVEDIIKYVKSSGWLIGSGRGSAAGCLVSYMLGITEVNPIPYDLLFERFYNAGRNTKDKISPPDIDLDIPKHKRQNIIQYIYDKYGHENCSQIITFQTMKGRGAIKAVLGAYGGIGFTEMNMITEHIPDQAKIADDLQEMKEEEGESSILKWCLENRADKFREFCEIKDGELVGPLSMRFAQAIRLEGTKTNASRHASGIIVGPSALSNYCPINHVDGENVTAFEGPDAESIGLLKLDILGLSLLDKLTGVACILEHGDILDDYKIQEHSH